MEPAFLVKLILFGLAMAAAAELSAVIVQATVDTPVPVSIYLPLGLGLGVLLAGGLPYWPGVALGGLFRMVFWYLQDPGDGVLEAAGVTVFVAALMLAEVLFAYWLARPGVPDDLDDPLLSTRLLTRLAVSTVLTSMLAALVWIWIITITLSIGFESAELWRLWALRFLANALGMALVTPTVLVLGRMWKRRRSSPSPG